MQTAFAALLFRADAVPDRALSHGFAVALAGWDVPDPYLEVAPVPELPGWSAAFYRVGKGGGGASQALTKEEAFDHAAELFEDELPPGLCVRDAAAELGAPDAEILALAYTEELIYDAAWRFTADGFTHRFVREGDDGLEAGVETLTASEPVPLDLAIAELDDASLDRALHPHRGSTFLADTLGRPVLAPLVRALFSAERRVAIRLIEPTAASIADETRRLNRVLQRVDGRGGGARPSASPSVPAVYAAFAEVYDFADPADPADLYRELSLGAIEGTLHFLRRPEIEQLLAGGAWAARTDGAIFPIAALRATSLGKQGVDAAWIGLGADAETLWLVARDGSTTRAGPTFGELLRYLALGWKTRTEVEEDLIGALMLRAKLRASAR
jgi:hypothetical protein